MTRTRIVIQSRLNSSRLPGKALMTIAGMPLIELVARRASRSGHEVVVATSDEHYDTRISDHLNRVDIPVMRGDLDDVLGRFVQATADLDDSDRVVRLTGDNPVADADLVDELLSAMDSSDHAYGRVDIEVVPEGLGAEAFTAGDLRRAAASATDSFDREHVTPWLRRNLGELLFAPKANPGDPRRFRCTVDVLSDYDRVSRLFANHPDPVAVPWADLIAQIAQPQFTVGPSLPLAAAEQLEQTRLTLGGGGLQPAAEAAAQTREMLAQAVNSGVSHIDVGGVDSSEVRTLQVCGEPQLTRRLGTILRLANVPDNSADAAYWGTRAATEQAFANLGRRSAAVLVLERADAAHLAGGASWRALQEYLHSGHTQKIGVRLQNLQQLPQALDLPDLGYIQVPYWAGCAALGPEVDQAADAGVIVNAYRVFDGGSLVRPGPQQKVLANLASKFGRMGVVDLALAYVLTEPAITSAIAGVKNAHELSEAITAAASAALTPTQMQEVRKALASCPTN